MIGSVFILIYFDIKNSHDLWEYDEKNRCFICHLSRDKFLKYKLDFVKHKKKVHNYLDYVFYIMYILTKDPMSLTKTEEYVLEKFRIHDFFWIPSQDTKILQQAVSKIRHKEMFITNSHT